MNAASKLFSKKAIIEFWSDEKARFRKKTTPGVDGQSRDDFASTIEAQAQDISIRVRSKTYRFRKLKPFAIPKDNGKIRLINVPTIRDRLVQRMLLKFLAAKYGDRWKIPQSFSSMGGEDEGVHKTLRSIATRISPGDFVIKTDLSRYFDTIERTDMLAVLKKRIRDRSLYPLLGEVIKCETSQKTPEEKGVFKKSDMIQNRGLRQGMPLSPVFAYLYLADVDIKAGENFYRYVDDLLFFGSDRDQVTEKFESYRKAVEERGLKIHELKSGKDAKTQLIGPDENFEFLGMKIVRSQNGTTFEIPSKSKVRIRKEIRDSSTYDRVDKKKQKRWVLSAANRASNLVLNYKSAYHICTNWDDFEQELRQLQISMCRSIARELSHVEKENDTELLRRLFGV